MNQELSVNSTLLHYRILSKIGSGGMGEVWLAEDTRLDRKIALKLLPAEFTQNADRVRRFVQEAKAASALNHPNIITVHDIGEGKSGRFIVMELVAGRTLRTVISEDNSLETFLNLSTQLAKAFSAAHAAGITHRDIKPDNIMVRDDGYVKVLDFGLARLLHNNSNDSEEATLAQQTMPGTIMGTVAYMSPEQARGESVSHPSDIFALGIVLYELATGRHPFKAETMVGYLHAITLQTPEPPQQWQPKLPAALNELILRMLNKEASQRPTASEVAQALHTMERSDGFAKAQLPESETMILPQASQSLAPSPQSIAILPFVNISADEDNEYFCDGLAEELLNALSKIEDLKVAARTSAFSFKGKNANVSEIGEKLSVKNVLEGSVRRLGNKLRISVQLINAADGYQIWSERYDREMKDIFDVQDEIALAVVDALRLKLFDDEKDALLKRYTNNPEVYQLYLKGRFYFDKFTAEGFTKSIEYYEQALAIEPDYAPAFAALANSYICFWYLGFGATAEYISKAQAAVKQALALDPELSETYFALALVKFNYERNWTEAEKAFRRGIELNPSYAENYEHYGMFLAVRERSEEAVAIAKRAIELAPLALKTIYLAGWAFWAAGQTDLAREQGEKLLEMEPNFSGGHTHLGINLWNNGASQKSLAALETAVKLGSGNEIKMLLGLLYGIVGEQEKANHLLAEFQKLDEEGIFTASHQAFVRAGLGEMNRAFALLEQAFARREGTLVFLKQFSSLLPKFHNDSRMTDLLNRLGLPTAKINQTDESLEAKAAMLSEPPAVAGGLTQSSQKPEINLATPTAKLQPSATADGSDLSAKSKYLLIGLLTLLLAVGGFFGYKYLFTPTSKQINSIAVLPFENKSSDADSEYLSNGLAESLIYRLSQLSDLKVSPTSSVFRYKGKATDPQVIAKELGVDSVMTGRITQRGDNLTISVNLVDTRNKKSLWGEQYERKMSELLNTQKEIASEITNKLQLKLSGVGEQKLAKNYTKNNEAYQLYLKGRFYWNKRDKENIRKAIEQFKAAADKDPNYALAFVGLADCYALLPFFSSVASMEVLPQAKTYATGALEIDESLGEAHASLGLIYSLSWNWAEAEKEFRRAIELNPNYAMAHHWFGQYLETVGRYDEAEIEYKRSLELEPLALVSYNNLAELYTRKGDSNAAAEQCQRVIELDPNWYYIRYKLADVYLKQGRNPEAIAEAEKSVELSKRQSVPLGVLGYIYAKSGRQTDATKIIEELKERNQKQPAGGLDIARVYEGLGDKDQVFVWLGKEFQSRNQRLPINLAIGLFDSLRDDPRYKDLRKRMGLPE